MTVLPVRQVISGVFAIPQIIKFMLSNVITGDIYGTVLILSCAEIIFLRKRYAEIIYESLYLG